MIDSSVDLPHPDGPEIDTYSPRAISMFTSASACVSTSSVTNTLVRLCSLTTGGGPLNSIALAPQADLKVGLYEFISLKADAIELFPRRHVRENHLVSVSDAGEHFD